MNTARQKCNMYLDKKRYRLVYIYCHNCFSSKTFCPLVKKDTLFVGIILWDRDKANQRDHYWSCWQWDGDRNLLGVPQGLVLRYSSFKFKLKFCPRTNFGIIYCFVGKLTYYLLKITKFWLMFRLKQAPTSNKHLERIIEYGPFSIGLFKVTRPSFFGGRGGNIPL